MGKQVDNRFKWVIKNFSSLEFKKVYSAQFVIGGCKWLLVAYPKGNNVDCLSLFLEVAGHGSLPSGWRRHVHYRLSIVNQVQEKLSRSQENTRWFDRKCPVLGFTRMFPLAQLHAKDSGYLMNGEVHVTAEIDIFKVIGELDESEERKVTTQPLKKTKLNLKKVELNEQPMEEIKLHDEGVASSESLNETMTQLNETVDVNGFLVLHSQVESVRRIFERHPDFATEFHSKNQHLKWTYMNVLLGLIETVCHLPEELSDEDLDEASVAFSYVAKGGFKLDWLEKKLEELKAKKKKVETGNARLKEMKQELQKFNQKCLDLKALVEKEKAEVLDANVRFLFDDVV